MKIVICASIDFTKQIKEVADFLKQQGHSVDIPLTSERILNNEITFEDFSHERETVDAETGIRESTARKIKDNVIKRYFGIIQKSDAILVINQEKKGIKNYIGGNTFLEMGFAHVLNKKLFLLNDIPDMPYTDEINAMQPIVLNGDLSKITA